MYIHSGTSLIRTPMWKKIVSLLVRCLHLQKWYILGVGKGVLFREVSSIQGSGIEGFHLYVHLRYLPVYTGVLLYK